VLPVYAPVSLPQGNPVDFYEARANPVLSDQLRRVVDGEGPLPEVLLFKRIARAWRLERTGSRISERLRRLVPADINRTREVEATFYWPTGADPRAWQQFRVAGNQDESRRHASEVCAEEISAVIKHVLHLAGSAPRSELAKTVCKVFGMARTPAEAEARVNAVVDSMLQAGAVLENEGYIRRP